MDFSAQQIADFLQGEVVGNPEITVNNLSKIDESEPGTLTFLSNPKYTHYVYDTKASIILVNKDFTPEQSISTTLIKVDDAYQSLAKLLQLVNSVKQQQRGIDSLAFIAKSAQIGENPYVGAFSFIGEGVKAGNNVQIYPQTYIGNNVTLGNDVIIYPGVKIYADCVIGNRCVVHAGTVIGADGFGFAPNDNGGYNKIPQIGNVILEDDVEIGANTTIDRATMGSTRIHKGVKLDNLIQVAHNVEIGQNSVLAAQTGVAGSVKIGENCMFGGQVGISGHLTIGNNVKLAAQTGVISKIPDNVTYMGAPAFSHVQYTKAYVVFRKLPELDKSIDALKKEIEELRKNIH
ncbi:UDP-3-O-(3-hydroxymyristoyl)glucosamine N-acyltransferase [Microbacter margulisiae]|uniref:UDP-3-O-acylglucosamine N-acyltransferase n=1 Tax=Microbacter margulisiae TaxID=1350067 RepID=A0A7W5DUG3_9PORP|nr:UDP-3-O-(3-hydroxymyristoyl)glucosamine N-acyltransferase [Microbacter margulisiae]MBB3188428.1 UDP-3-O-[3-hydroxymyristoyl] glucosamine N-acyltransferase [Microbacter margulisiae]